MAEIIGTNGGETLAGGAEADTIDGLGGNDELRGFGGNDSLSGGDGNDTLIGGEGIDTLIGGAGADRLSEAGVGGVLQGGAGEDNLTSEGSSLVDGGADDDSISARTSDTVLGGDGSDFVSFFADAISITAGAGDDTVSGSGNLFEDFGPVSIDAGEGADRVSLGTFSSNSAVSVTLGTGSDTLEVQSLSFGTDAITVTDFSADDVIELNGLVITAEFVQVVDDGTNTTLTIDNEATGDFTDDRQIVLQGLTGQTFQVVPSSNGIDTLIRFSTDGETPSTPTEGDDSLGGTAGSDTIDGLGGNDELRGFGGNDSLSGGDGNDTLIGGEGIDTLIGGAGADRLSEAGVGGVLQGGAGEDNLTSEGSSLVDGGAGDDGIFAGTSDTVLGGDGSDFISFFADAINITAGAGDDTVSGSGNLFEDFGPVSIDAGEGADRVSLGTFSPNSAVSVTLGTGSDTLEVQSLSFGTDAITVTDFSADDVIELNGLVVTAEFVQVVDDGTNTTLTIDNEATGDFTDDRQIILEGVTGQTFEVVRPNATSGDTQIRLASGPLAPPPSPSVNDDTLPGTAGSDTVDGLGGNDELRGFGGNDSLSGGDGNDTLIGGEGIDTLIGGAGADRLSEAGVGGVLQGGAGEDNLTSEGSSLVDGGADDDGIFAGTSDTVLGGDGSDFISFFADAINITAGAGEDTVSGSGNLFEDFGPVSIDAGEGADRVSLGTFSPSSAVSVTLGTGSDTLEVQSLFFGTDVITVTDFSADDVIELNGLVVTAEFVQVVDDGTNTTLTIDNEGNGGFTDDRQVILEGVTGQTFEVIRPEPTSSDSQLRLAGSNAGDNVIIGTEGNDRINGGAGNDTLSGQGGDDTLLGGDDSDVLDGGTGGDRLNGGLGADRLTLGLGADLVEFVAGDGADTLTDFDLTEDRIFGFSEDDVSGVTASGSDAILTLTSGDTLTFQNTASSALAESLSDIIVDEIDDPAVVSIAPASSLQDEGDDGTTSFTFAVSRSGDLAGSVTVDYAVTGSGVDAADAADFSGGVLPSGTVTFAAGETTQTLTIDVAGDRVPEFDEGFTVSLLNPSGGAVLGDASVEATIRNDEDGTLALIQLDQAVPATISGQVGLSTDGLGTVDTGTLQAEIPAGSTIEAAFLHVATRTSGGGPFRPESIGFGGETIALTALPNVANSSDEDFETLRADVTDIVRSGVTSSGGIFDFDVDETVTGSPAFVEGTSLSVIFSNPALPERSIFLLDGGLTGPVPQTNTISFAEPLDPTADDFLAELALGIQFGFEGSSQFSTVDMNGERLTSSAGGSDDNALSFAQNGLLVTVGGVGDDPALPTDPQSSSTFLDDELYDVSSLIAPGTQTLAFETANPSDDDLIFLLALEIGGVGSFSVEDVSLAVLPNLGDQSEGDTGTTAFTFTATRTGDLAESTSVDFTVTGSGVDAANAADFVGGVLPSGTVTFAPGETTQTITLDIAGDAVFEPDETFTVTLSGATQGATIVGASAVGTIRNDDAAAPEPIRPGDPGPLSNTLSNTLGGESGFGENTVSRNDDGNSGAIDITPVFGADGVNFFGETFTEVFINTNGNLSFGNSVSQFTRNQIGAGISTPIIAPYWADVDTRGGAPEEPTPGGNSQGTNLIYYDLDPEAGVFTVTWDDVGYFSSRTDPLNAFQVQLVDTDNGNFDIIFRYEDINWTTGNASGGSGGLGGTPARAGYSAGNGVDFFELPQSGDQDAMLALEATEGNAGLDGVWRFSVADGIVAPLVSIATTTPVIAEGDAGTTAFTFTVTRGGDTSGEVSAAFSVTGVGQAPATSDDFVDGFPSGTVTFTPGQTQQTVTVQVAADLVEEADESFAVVLSNVSPGASLSTSSATATILNDDTTPADGTVSFAEASLSVAEGFSGTTGVSIPLRITGPIAAGATVDFSVVPTGESGATGEDFADGVLPSGTVTLAGGMSDAVVLEIASNLVRQDDRTFDVVLSNPQGVTLADTGTSLPVTIVDDDNTPSVLLVDSNGRLFDFEIDSGVSRPVGDLGASPEAVAFNGTGDAFVLDGFVLETVAIPGVADQLVQTQSSVTLSRPPTSMAWDFGNDRLLGLRDGRVFEIDPETGNQVDLGSFDVDVDRGLTVDGTQVLALADDGSILAISFSGLANGATSRVVGDVDDGRLLVTSGDEVLGLTGRTVVSLDPATGTPVTVGSVQGGLLVGATIVPPDEPDATGTGLFDESLVVLPDSADAITSLGQVGGTTVYRVDLGATGVDSVGLITLMDDGVFSGGRGASTGFDLDFARISTTRAETAEAAAAAPPLAGFDLDTAVFQLDAGGQSRVLPGDPLAWGTADAPVPLFGTVEGEGGVDIDLSSATLDTRDAVEGSDQGLLSLGLEGALTVELADNLPTEGLFLYLGELGSGNDGFSVRLAELPPFSDDLLL